MPRVRMLLSLLAVASMNAAAVGASFVGLGGLSDSRWGRATGISADGSVVVGVSENATGNLEAFRWTAASGMLGLGYVDHDGIGAWKSFATGVSGDGSTVVGHSEDVSAAGGPGTEAFVWTESTGLVGQGFMPDNHNDSLFNAVSFDGTVAVGSGFVLSHGRKASHWTPSTGMVNLGTLPDYFHSVAMDVSDDGSVVVGYAQKLTDFSMQAFRWTAETGMTGLGFFDDSLNFSTASAVSADGSVIVGVGLTSAMGGGELFRWTEGDGLVGLGSHDNLSVSGVSADGSVIVGQMNAPGSFVAGASIFDPLHGMRFLQDVLSNQGLAAELAGWHLEFATAVSADGRTIVGYGTNPLGGEEAWIATIDVPEPSALRLAMGAAVCGLTVFGARRCAGRARPSWRFAGRGCR